MVSAPPRIVLPCIAALVWACGAGVIDGAAEDPVEQTTPSVSRWLGDMTDAQPPLLAMPPGAPGQPGTPPPPPPSPPDAPPPAVPAVRFIGRWDRSDPEGPKANWS